MTRILSTLAFLLGAIAVIWMGSAFIGTNTLALTVVAIIAAVYTVGFVELLRFQHATSNLLNALNTSEPVTHLDDWLKKIPAVLQDSVRLRIEGERIGLPTPVITPYLVGLLVMLGLLGTFAGMVDTLNGAVMALKGTTELEAIRAGLSKPIEGLAMAFGTSVAGVATSAMLGFISTLSRRDRMLAARLLDNKTTNVLQAFSLSYNRQQTYTAMQLQAQTLPDVAATLATLAEQLSGMGQTIGDQLIANQDAFHTSTQAVYKELASDIDQSLKHSLAESGRLAGEGIHPIIRDMMKSICQQTQETQEKLSTTAQQQLETLTARYSNNAEDVSKAWKAGLDAHAHANESLITGMSNAFSDFKQQSQDVSTSLLTHFHDNAASVLEQQQNTDTQRLDVWTNAFSQAQQLAAKQLTQASGVFTSELKHISNDQKTTFNEASQSFSTLTHKLSTQWQEAGQQSQSLQEKTCTTLQQLANELSNNAQHTSHTMLSQISQLLHTSEQLVETRIETEANWLSNYNDRIQELTTAIAKELTALTTAEEARGEKAAQHLQQLGENMGSSLSTLRADEEKRADAAMTRLQALNTTLSSELAALRVTEETRGDAAVSRLEQLSTTISTELTALRTAEETRGDAAVARLAELQGAVTEHLSSLGHALEEPMQRLILSASETPKAAAEVIEQLRAEITKNIERDNDLLQERGRIMSELNTLSGSLQQSTTGQREAIEKMVNASEEMLHHVGNRFNDFVGSEIVKLTSIVDHFSGSATEMASLGEAFGIGVELFDRSNNNLVDNLCRIEEALQNSTVRSDEQLAYYVAQAREIIDHNMLSQQEIIAQLSQLSRKTNTTTASAS